MTYVHMNTKQLIMAAETQSDAKRIRGAQTGGIQMGVGNVWV